MQYRRAFAAWTVFFFLCNPAWTQYQSLFWEVSGGELKQPSYLYGTMHISSRIAFQLGDPFYDAMQSTDVVALELEPDQWLNALFEDPQVNALLGSSIDDSYEEDYISESPLPNLRGLWQVGNGMQLNDRVREALLYEPDILNYLMYRYGEDNLSVDFEEDTWLDMHIYQTAKKMGLETMGLETYAQSDAFIRKAGLEDAMENDLREWDEGDIQEYEQLNGQLEPAYRRQDLDLIDSLSRATASKAFYTYILLERNKLFVHSIDSLLKSGKSVFAAMGCAHLPGKAGVIELLRALGYEVSPINKGSRNAKRRQELEKRIFDHTYTRFTTPDGIISFRTPVPVYHAGANKEADTWLSIDMANGANYTVTRLKSYASVMGYSGEGILAMLDSMMYETIAGEIISKKRIRLSGVEGIDIINRTRRGDYRRQQVWVLPDEILILKLAANGDKVKQGYGDVFFSDVQLHISATTDNQWKSSDGAVSITLPSRGVSYVNQSSAWQSADFEVIATESSNGAYYLLQRHVVEDPGFLDEDAYELSRLLNAFAEDWSAEVLQFRGDTHNGMPALQAHLRIRQSDVFVLLALHNLSYLVLSTNDQDAARRNARFSSFRVSNPVYSTFFDYDNNELFFKTKLPYTPEEFASSLESLMFNADLEEPQNSSFGTNASIALSPPGDAQTIEIDFQRYHEFSDGEDTASFLRDKRELVIGLDMRLLSEKVQWNPNGAVFEFMVGDTGSCRRYMHKMLLHNKAYYHLAACFDSTAGPSDFITTAFDNFVCTDTVFPYPHFRSRDEAYLNAITSTDTLVRAKAIAITGEMDFSSASAAHMREVVTHLSSFNPEDAAMIRTKLIAGLAADTSSVNIDFVVSQFNAFPDSADYQFELLSLLLQMKTARAWRTYTKLIVEEPPIVFDEMGGSGCEALYDSVRLAAPLIPQLMQLLAIDEYEESIYHLMAMAADSGWLPVNTYRYMVPQILVEARNEWKRLRNMNDDRYVFNTDALLDYCTLLNPLRKEKEVAQFFEKAYSSRNGSILLDLMAFDWDHGRAPSDSLISRLVRMNDQVHNVYDILWQHDASSRMPEPFTSRNALAELYLKNGYDSESERIDSVVIIDRHTEQIRGTKLDVFFYKVYKPSSDQWLGHVLAFDASTDKNAWPLFIESERSVVLDPDEDPLKELQSEYRFMEENNREFVNFGTGAGDFSVQWY